MYLWHLVAVTALRRKPTKGTRAAWEMFRLSGYHFCSVKIMLGLIVLELKNNIKTYKNNIVNKIFQVSCGVFLATKTFLVNPKSSVCCYRFLPSNLVSEYGENAEAHYISQHRHERLASQTNIPQTFNRRMAQIILSCPLSHSKK